MPTFIPGVKFKNEQPAVQLKDMEHEGVTSPLAYYDPATDTLNKLDGQGKAVQVFPSKWVIQMPDAAEGDWLIGRTKTTPFDTMAEAEAVNQTLPRPGILRRLWGPEDAR